MAGTPVLHCRGSTFTIECWGPVGCNEGAREAKLNAGNIQPENRTTRQDAGSLLIPAAVGELIDKITILEIKSERIADPAKLRNIRAELRLLVGVRDTHVAHGTAMNDLSAQLKKVNEELWDIEDEIRECERRRDFGARFVELARSVYQSNDRRSRLKREINEASGSPIIEEKSYAPY
jgi:hypothetical protein